MMRVVLVFLLLASLLCWSTTAAAFSRPLARRCDGDPDEFQSRPVHNEFSFMVTRSSGPGDGAYEPPDRMRFEKPDKNSKTRSIVTRFSGMIFLER